MSLEIIFEFVTYAVLLPWSLLVFLPRWRVTYYVVYSIALPVLFSLLYVWFFLAGSQETVPTVEGVAMMESVMSNFSTPQVFLAGWIHFLLFDLLVGAWITKDAAGSGVHHIAVVPCLALTLFAGPAGLLLYIIIRFFVSRNFFLAVDDAEITRSRTKIPVDNTV